MLIARTCLIEQPVCCVCFVIPKDGSAQVGVFWLVEGPWQYRGSLWSQFGNLQGRGRLPLPEKSEAAWEFWVVLCSFCVVGVFNLNSSDCSRVRDEGLRGTSVINRVIFHFSAFVDLFCSPALGTHKHHFLSALKICQGTGLLLQSQGHKKSITY